MLLENWSSRLVSTSNPNFSMVSIVTLLYYITHKYDHRSRTPLFVEKNIILKSFSNLISGFNYIFLWPQKGQSSWIVSYRSNCLPFGMHVCLFTAKRLKSIRIINVLFLPSSECLHPLRTSTFPFSVFNVEYLWKHRCKPGLIVLKILADHNNVMRNFIHKISKFICSSVIIKCSCYLLSTMLNFFFFSSLFIKSSRLAFDIITVLRVMCLIVWIRFACFPRESKI